jgi:hypothetical protein
MPRSWPKASSGKRSMPRCWLSWPAPCRNHGQPLARAPSSQSLPTRRRQRTSNTKLLASPPRWRHGGHGTMVARLAPDQQAGSSESLCPHCLLVVSHLLLCRLPSLLPRKPRASIPATALLAERLTADSRSVQTVPSSILGGRIWRGAAKRDASGTASDAKKACATHQPNACLEPKLQRSRGRRAASSS